MQKTSLTNFVVIGYGHIGKRHAEILNNYPQSSVVAIVDLNINHLIFNDHEIPFFSSIEALIESNIAFDAAIIATPNGLHAEHAITCLNLGKHVVIEKPIATTTFDAQRIYDAALINNKKVFVVFQNRYSPISLWLKDVLAAKRLGKIFMIQLNCFWNRDHSYYKDSWHGTIDMDGGTLFTQFSHYIDALYWLFGDIRGVQSEFFNFNKKNEIEFEDSGVVTFDLNGGGKGSFSFSTAVYGKNLESSMTIIAENGTIKIGGQYMEEVMEVNAKSVRYPVFKDLITTNHQSFLYDVMQRIQNDQDPSISPNEVLQVIELIEKIYISAALVKV